MDAEAEVDAIGFDGVSVVLSDDGGVVVDVTIWVAFPPFNLLRSFCSLVDVVVDVVDDVVVVDVVDVVVDSVDDDDVVVVVVADSVGE